MTKDEMNKGMNLESISNKTIATVFIGVIIFYALLALVVFK